jgi:poly(glycerol-phosphate) alpha-glucosyltransferase
VNICYLSQSSSASAGGIYEIEKALAARVSAKNGLDLTVCAFFDNGHCDGWPERSKPVLFGQHESWVRSHIKIRNFLKSNEFDLIHLHNLWTFSSLLALEARIKRAAVTVVTINGMLDPWALSQSKYKKIAAGVLYERLNLNMANLIHVNSEREAEDCRRYGIRGPIAIIPNGVDCHPELSRRLISNRAKRRDSGKRKVLFLGRLHQKKGIIPLIKAWSTLSVELRSNWELDIVGWDDGDFEPMLRRAIADQGVADSVNIKGPAFGEQKSQTFADSDVFILPSYSEGLPMAVLEAWSFGIPTIITPDCNLPIGISECASLEVLASPEEIFLGLNEMLTMSSAEHARMGSRGLDLVCEKFSWDSVATELIRCYSWLMDGGKPPSCVLFE